MISRRTVLTGLTAGGLGSLTVAGYAFAEYFSWHITHYALTPPRWPASLRLRLAVITDLHAIDPWMTPERIAAIVAHTNGLAPDAVLLLGDFVAGRVLLRSGNLVPHLAWAEALAGLRAPLGTHAVLGNHDWWEDANVQRAGTGPTPAGRALQQVGIPVYENAAVRLTKDGGAFWIAGLGDQWAFWPTTRERWRLGRGQPGYFRGRDDLAATLAAVTDEAPVILMVHEPDVFPTVPARVSLTLAGHTHGGQVRVLGYAPVVPSRFGRRYTYGHIVEDGRHMIVSAGLGCSGLPLRLGSSPEIVIIDLGIGAPAA